MSINIPRVLSSLARRMAHHPLCSMPRLLVLAAVSVLPAACASAHPGRELADPPVGSVTPPVLTSDPERTRIPTITIGLWPSLTPTPAILEVGDLARGEYVVYCGFDGEDDKGEPVFSLFVASAPNRIWGRLARGPCRAVLSQDRQILAYEIYGDSGAIEIELLNLPASVKSPLPGSSGCQLGSWSPDGYWLAVGCEDGEIHLLSPKDASPGAITNCSVEGAYCYRPAWSPDGTMIAFEYSFEFHPNNGLYILEAACIPVPESCPSATTYEVLGAGPYGWSPDSRSVSFSRRSAEVGIIDIRTNATRFFPIGPDQGGAIRAPDGEEFAYSDGSQVFIAKEDGSQPTSITSGLTDKTVQFWLIIP